MTNKHIFTLDLGTHNYNVHRKVCINLIEAITTSKVASTTEVVFHFTGDYDERYDAGKHYSSLIFVVKSILTALGNQYKVYDVPEKKLRKYNTSKREARKL